jgi:hypothetical protein
MTLYSNGELKVLRRIVSRTRSVANKVTWRAAVQRRTSRIAGIVRSLPSFVLAPIVSRAKGPEGWLVIVADIDGEDRPALEIVIRTAGRTVESLADPVTVRIHRPDLVDIRRLKELEQDGKVTVVFPEPAS